MTVQCNGINGWEEEEGREGEVYIRKIRPTSGIFTDRRIDRKFLFLHLLRRSGRAVCLYWTAHKTQLTIYKLEDFLPATLFPDLLTPNPLADVLTISSNITTKLRCLHTLFLSVVHSKLSSSLAGFFILFTCKSLTSMYVCQMTVAFNTDTVIWLQKCL